MLDTKGIIDDLAQAAIDGIDMSCLLRFYYDNQEEYYKDLTEEELLEAAEDYLHNFDVEDYLI